MIDFVNFHQTFFNLIKLKIVFVNKLKKNTKITLKNLKISKK